MIVVSILGCSILFGYWY